MAWPWAEAKKPWPHGLGPPNTMAPEFIPAASLMQPDVPRLLRAHTHTLINMLQQGPKDFPVPAAHPHATAPPAQISCCKIYGIFLNKWKSFIYPPGFLMFILEQAICFRELTANCKNKYKIYSKNTQWMRDREEKQRHLHLLPRA